MNSAKHAVADSGGRGDTLYEEYDIRPGYDDPNAYGIGNSYYGNGRYPPDWNNRREAVWARQKYQCGRCGTYKGDVAVSEVHHVIHLANGGSNRLGNLVGLCGDCHALMHPDVGEMSGSYVRAELFPSEYADDRVAVVRRPNGNAPLAHDLSRLEAFSSPDTNRYAVTSAAVATSVDTAKRSESELHSMLVERGYVPRTSAYHRVRVAPQFTGYWGVFTSYRPDLSVTDDASASESEWHGGNEYCDCFYTPDATETKIQVRGGAGGFREEQVRLPADEDGARLRLETPIDPPELTLRTAPRYAFDASKYFGWGSVMWGIVPALVLAWLGSSVLPFEFSLASVLALALLVGLVLRAPKMRRDFGRTPERRLIDERQSESA